MTIQKEDVINVAIGINKTLTEEQINQVLEMYPTEQDRYPTDTWNLVIENSIYQILKVQS
jgi:hypothetical protein